MTGIEARLRKIEERVSVRSVVTDNRLRLDVAALLVAADLSVPRATPLTDSEVVDAYFAFFNEDGTSDWMADGDSVDVFDDGHVDERISGLIVQNRATPNSTNGLGVGEGSPLTLL